MKLRNGLSILVIALMVIFSFTSETNAQVSVVRGGEENPVITIGKSTLYGAGTGLLLGLALSLVVDEDTGDVVKWSFVGGTFGGFLLGIYHVASRPGPGTALLEFDKSRMTKINIPEPQLKFTKASALISNDRSLEIKVPLVAVSL